MIFEHFDARQFVNEYWQKKPCLIRQFAPNFQDPIDENDLAGLAQEEGVDSRIVSHDNGTWDVHQGPFDDFEPYCKGEWALLVQGVNHYIDEVDALAELVNFIPYWRFDDVMVSYSTEHAGVGAHTDEYDVFILQGKGSRRWQVGLPIGESDENEGLKKANKIVPHPLLQQIKEFEALIDEVLLPGDAIYIPPRHPHKGTTLSACLNYSLGFRAPTNLETLTGLIDESDNIAQAQARYTDPNIAQLRNHSVSPMQVSTQELNRLKDNIMQLLNSPQAEQSLLQYLSRQGLPSPEASHVVDIADVSAALSRGEVFERYPGVKPIYGEQQQHTFIFYIDGNMFEVDKAIHAQTLILLQSQHVQGLPPEFVNDSASATHYMQLLVALINAGYWDIAEKND